MQLLGNPTEVSEKRSVFFRLVFGKNEGYVCLAFIDRQKKDKFTEDFYRYPQDLDRILVDVDKYANMGRDVYFCPHLFADRKRNKESVQTTPSAWSDLDTCQPSSLLVKPSITIESSPGRFQALWIFSDDVDPDDAEELSRRIAYHHADEGADRSGWDLTQLLRVPLTFNHKYAKSIDIPVVSVRDATKARYRLDDFSMYPKTLGYKHIDEPIPDALDEGADELLIRYRGTLSPLAIRTFDEIPDEDWSKPLWNLQMLLFEAGMTKEEVFTVVQESKCNKYRRDGKSMHLLWKEVVRAEERFKSHLTHISPDVPHVQLLRDAERDRLATLPDTFVERYQNWAKSLGDAAPQYHQAGAFTVLSSLLCGSVELPTSFGTLVPNLWFMILADTTLTRKSTSMDIAMDVAEEIDSEILLATDGSLEGLLGVLGGRPNTPSVFLRDEFSGLLELITKRDYYAGMAELLTKLYDGKTQKRVLRKEVVEVKQPRLIVYAGGIKNKITGLLTFEHVSSGFMPRFIFITAESDIARVKPLGPPETATTNGREEILEELRGMYNHYQQQVMIHIEKLQGDVAVKKTWQAKMVPEAWLRYNEFESEMLQAGLSGERPEIMTPVHDRLSKSVLKAATLIAASEQRTGEVTIEMDHLIRAIAYGEQWRMYVLDVMENVGKGTIERKLDTLYRAIAKKDGGIPRSKLMQNYHLGARDAQQAIDTLVQRGQVRSIRKGQAEILVAIKET